MMMLMMMMMMMTTLIDYENDQHHDCSHSIDHDWFDDNRNINSIMTTIGIDMVLFFWMRRIPVAWGWLVGGASAKKVLKKSWSTNMLYLIHSNGTWTAL